MADEIELTDRQKYYIKEIRYWKDKLRTYIQKKNDLLVWYRLKSKQVADSEAKEILFHQFQQKIKYYHKMINRIEKKIDELSMKLDSLAYKKR